MRVKGETWVGVKGTKGAIEMPMASLYNIRKNLMGLGERCLFFIKHTYTQTHKHTNTHIHVHVDLQKLSEWKYATVDKRGET